NLPHFDTTGTSLARAPARTGKTRGSNSTKILIAIQIVILIGFLSLTPRFSDVSAAGVALTRPCISGSLSMFSPRITHQTTRTVKCGPTELLFVGEIGRQANSWYSSGCDEQDTTGERQESATPADARAGALGIRPHVPSGCRSGVCTPVSYWRERACWSSFCG